MVEWNAATTVVVVEVVEGEAEEMDEFLQCGVVNPGTLRKYAACPAPT